MPAVQCPKCVTDKRCMWSVYPGINEYSKRKYPEVDKECLWCELCDTFYVLFWDNIFPKAEWVMKLKEVMPIG